MCTVAIDGNFKCNAIGWQGEDSSSLSLPSTNSDAYCRLEGITTATCSTDSYILDAKLLLVDEFVELESDSRLPITSLKLYLTNCELVVARKFEDSERAKTTLIHLRTHNLKEVEVELDKENSSIMVVRTRLGTFLYRIRSGAAALTAWMNRIFRLKRTSVSPTSSDSTTTAEERTEQPSSDPTHSVPACIPVLKLQPSEWHGEDLICYSTKGNKLLSDSCKITESLSVPNIFENSLLPSAKPLSVERQPQALKRRKAFRVPDLESFLNNKKLRSSSAPPDEQSETPTNMLENPNSRPSSSSENILSPSNSSDKILQTPRRKMSFHKRKLKFSPKAREFTRALSARLIPTPTKLSPKHENKEVRRAVSLTQSSTLPRQIKQKEKNYGVRKPNNRARCRSAVISTPEPSPRSITPSKPKSPGSLLKIFHRKWASSNAFRVEDIMSSMENTDNELDLYNRPTYLKLYLQSPKELAEELTLIDAEMFHSIDQSELENGAWTKKTKYSLSPNVLKMIDSFNHLARIVCTEIVHEKSVSARAKAISSYIQLAGKCYRLRNYNSMKSIIAGLQSQAVYRLKRSWSQVPSRRRKKYEKYENLLSQLDCKEQLQKEMMYNLENNIHCVPYLGWLLTQVLHSQTYKKLQDQREVVFRHRSSSLKVNDVSKRKSWRESACTISLPSSPIQSEDESEEKETKLIIQSNTSQPSCDNILITRCFSDTNINTYDSESATRVDTPVSPHNDIDFGFPTIEKYSVKNSHILHPLAVNNNMTTQMPSVFKRDFEHQTSSDSSVDESNQTDSAIGLDSSIGQPSPAHEKPKENQMKLSNYVKQHLRSESINSFFTGNDDDYCLPSVDSNFEEDESDDDDDATDVFHVSFTETSDPYSYSPSRSLSPLSPSMISLSLISEPNTPVKSGNKRRITLPDLSLIHIS